MADVTAAGRRAAIARAGGWGLALAWPVIAGAMLGLSIAIFLLQPLWDDPSWYLYVASRWLAGAHLYGRELVDVDPPLIVWISAIGVSLGHLLDISSIAAQKLLLAAVLLGSIAWSLRIIRRLEGPGSNRFCLWLAVALLYVAVVHVPPLFVFGQREHFLIALVLPYLILTASRLQGRTVASWEATGIGLSAAIGVCLKPHHLLMIGALEAFGLWRLRTLRLLIRADLIALVICGLAYCAAVVLFTPDYIFKVIPLDWKAYLDWGRVPLLSLAYPLTRWVKLLALAITYVVLRRHLHHKELVTTLLISGCAALGAYLIQHRGDEYTLLPEMVFFNLAACVIAIDVLHPLLRSPSSLAKSRALMIGSALIGCIIGAAAAYRMLPLQFAPSIAEESAYEAALGQVPAGTPIYELTPDGFDPLLFDLIMRHDWRWASRFNGLWMLESIFEDQNAPSSDDRARAARLTANVRNAVDEDFERWHPRFVFVERCADASIAPCFSMEAFRIDLPTWLMQEPRFRRIWSQYQFKRRVGRYDFYALGSQ